MAQRQREDPCPLAGHLVPQSDSKRGVLDERRVQPGPVRGAGRGPASCSGRSGVGEMVVVAATAYL